jgi:hypothetical protein
MSTTKIGFVLLGLALVAYGIISHGSVVARTLAIAVGTIVFLLGLAFDHNPRDDPRRWR